MKTQLFQNKRMRIVVSLWPIFAIVLTAVTPVIASAASNTAGTTVSATIGDVISISSAGTVSLSIVPTSGGAVSSASDTVTVSTNKASGYTLSLADSDSTASLVSGSDTFTAHAGTFAAPTALANGKWGYAVAGGNFDASYSAETSNNSSTSKWAGVPVTGSPQTIKTTASAATSDTTTVWYAAKANTSQPAGTYSDSVTYTATTN